VEVEWLMLADRADVIGNKLYAMGGGWDVLTVNSPLPLQQPCGIAVSFVVDWNEDTNRPHDVTVDVRTEDGQTIWSMGGGIEVGRPPGIRPGQDQHVQIAANVVLSIPALGTYVLVAQIGAVDQPRTRAFNVVPGPMFGAASPAS
jgi:hypothetical protein